MDQTRPLVSVIVPVFNGARFLKRSVGSALAQTVQDIEVVVVDDGSSDHPEHVIEAFDGRARVVHQPCNQGLSAARNRGIAEARGTFIALLDADDWWVPQKLETQLQAFAADSTVDVVCTDFIHVYPDGSPGPWQGGLLAQCALRRLKLRAIGPAVYAFEECLVVPLVKHTSFMHPSTMLIRREALESTGRFDERLRGAEDLQMWIRLAHRCRIALVDAVLVSTEQRCDSLGHNTWFMAEQLIKMYSTLPEFLPNLPVEALRHIKAFCAREHTSLGWAYRNRGDRVGARRHYSAALHYKFRWVTLLRWLRAWLPQERIVPEAR